MICGKKEERLCGDGPQLQRVLRNDSYLIRLREGVIMYFKSNFEAAEIYVQRFEFIRKFFVENLAKSHSSIMNEVGKLNNLLP